MRRILINSPDEFKCKNINISQRLALKKLSDFFDGVNMKTKRDNVIISNKINREKNPKLTIARNQNEPNTTDTKR